MAYVRLPVDRGFQDILNDAVAFLIAQSGGTWKADTGALETWILEAFSREAERLLTHAGDMTDEAYTTFGLEDVGLPQQTGVPATVASTWTLRHDDGHTITAGTLVAVGPDQQLFAVVADVTVPPASTSTAAGEVDLAAVETGVQGNGIPAGTAQLVSLDAAVATIVTTATTAGGVDDETDGEYRSRLRDDIRLQVRIAVTADDLPTQARRITGVHRALAIKGYDAVNDLADQPGHATVVGVDENGDALDAPTKTELEAELTASNRRILNGTIHVIDHTLVAVAVDFSAVAEADADPDVAEAAAIAAITAELDPATFAGGDQDPPMWTDDTVVRHDRMVQLVRNTPGIAYLDGPLTINGVEANLDLSAGGVIAPLPNAVGTVTGTVTAP
jgi:hypothetical protein